MGLTIHYTLTATRKLDEKEVRQRVQQTARLAWRIGCEYVGKVLPSAASDPHAPACFNSRADNERRMLGGSRTRGWLVEILPGAGCETITLGLCQQYRLVTRDPKGRQKHWWPVYQPDGWMFNAFCKTYYVAEHGSNILSNATNASSTSWICGAGRMSACASMTKAVSGKTVTANCWPLKSAT